MASKIQCGSGKTPHWRSLTQIPRQKGFVVLFLKSWHSVIHNQLRLLRQIYGHFWLDPAKQEGLQDALQLSSCKQKHITRASVWRQSPRIFHNTSKVMHQHLCMFVLKSLQSYISADTETVVPRAGWLRTFEYELTKSSTSSAVKMLGWMKLSRE